MALHPLLDTYSIRYSSLCRCSIRCFDAAWKREVGLEICVDHPIAVRVCGRNWSFDCRELSGLDVCTSFLFLLRHMIRLPWANLCTSLGAVYNAGYFQMSTWIPFIWSLISVLILVLASFTIQFALWNLATFSHDSNPSTGNLIDISAPWPSLKRSINPNILHQSWWVASNTLNRRNISLWFTTLSAPIVSRWHMVPPLGDTRVYGSHQRVF